MPIINGQKMACEPCIRGHRSTKCTHANERLMVPVRKPGRPLSMCPHPATRPCSCGQLTAAIPKKQKCGCGSKAGASSQAKTEDYDSNKEPTPLSPSKASNSVYRIQKNARKPSISSSRKSSVDLAGLERMDVSQMNIIPPFNGLHQKAAVPVSSSMSAVPEMAAYGPLAMTPAQTPFTPMMYHMFPPPMLPSPMMTPGGSNALVNGHSLPGSDSNTAVSTPARPSDSSRKKGSCCGGGGRKPSLPDLSMPHSQEPASERENASDQKPKSCCSSQKNSPPPEQKLEAAGMPTAMPSYQAPMVAANGMYPYYPHPTIFTYPPHYGSFMQPLQPEQWRQMMAMNMGHSMIPTGQFAMPGPEAFQQLNMSTPTAGTSHQCGCGDGCQCVGCAAHPYNEATQNYVRSAWESMMEMPSSQAHSNATQVQPQTNGHDTNTTPTTSGPSNSVSTMASGVDDGTISPVAPETPSEAASGLSEEQTLSASDFFFVSYPFGDSCAGETASCPCGDDCQCLGCVIHNNPGPTGT